MKCPFGNSNSRASSSSKPSLRQIAFDGALSTFGKACMKRCLLSRLARLTAFAVAATAMPRPLELGYDHPTDLVDVLITPVLGPVADRADTGTARRVDDLEHAVAALEPLVAALTLAQLLRRLGSAQVLGHARVPHQALEQRQVAAAPGLDGHGRAHV